jgi:hypothetical protein
VDPSRREKLEKLALERLHATANDKERRSYAWGRCLVCDPHRVPRDHPGAQPLPENEESDFAVLIAYGYVRRPRASKTNP